MRHYNADLMTLGWVTCLQLLGINRAKGDTTNVVVSVVSDCT